MFIVLSVKHDTMHNVHRKKYPWNTTWCTDVHVHRVVFQWHLCDAHFCIMLCHSRVSHPSLQCAGAFVASSTLSQTIKHHVFFIRFFCWKWSTNSVQTHTHTSLVNHAMNTIYLTSMHNFQLGMFQTIWMHDCMVSKYVFVAYVFFFFKLFFRFSTCISKLYFSTLNVFRWTSFKNKLDVFQWNFPLLGFSNLISKLDYPKSAANPNLARSSRCQVQTESWLNLDWVQSDSRYPHHPHLSSSSSSSCCRRLWTWKKIVCRRWSKSGASRRLGLDWV